MKMHEAIEKKRKGRDARFGMNGPSTSCTFEIRFDWWNRKA